MRRRWAVAALAVVAFISFFNARQRMASYENEPGQHFERVAVETGALFSSYPVVSRTGLFYQSMGHERYVLRWLHDGRSEELAFEGQAVQPRLARDGVSVDFELVANRNATLMEFDPSTRKSTQIAMATNRSAAVVSPDRKWMAFESDRDGPTHIWLRDLVTGHETRLTGGNCNSTAPAWELDSKALIFASDCQRAFGLPALYRARTRQSEN
jgi:hypothetical protein